MGFFKSAKDKLGIGGVSVTINAPGQISKDDASVDGSVSLTTKSEQEVVDMTVKLVEEFTTGRGNDKKTKTIELGEVTVPIDFTINPGETKEVKFSLPFEAVKSNAQSLKEKGGAMGALGSLSKMANSESSEYLIKAKVDVKSATLDPTAKQDIKLV